MTSSSFVSPLDCLTSFLGISLSRAVSSFGRITNVPKLAITAESYIRSWRKPPEMPEVCRMSVTVGAPPPTGQSPDCTCVGVAVWRAEMAVSSHCKGDAFPFATLSLARLQVDPIGHRPDWLQRRLESGESDTLSHGMEAADQTPPRCLSSSSRCNIV